jgi:hypothetical protein
VRLEYDRRAALIRDPDGHSLFLVEIEQNSRSGNSQRDRVQRINE